MHYSFLRILFLVTIILLAGSCKKGELPKEYYYGRLQLSVVPLPNTPSLDVYLNGEKLAVLEPNGPVTKILPVQKGKLEFYEAGSQELLADTMLNLEANSSVSLRYAYNKDFGLSGFVVGGAVPADSFAVQFMNELSDFYKPYTSVDLEICIYDFNVGWYVPNGEVIENFTATKLSPKRILLPVADADGLSYLYFARMKNNLTGEYIIQPGLGMEFFYLGSGNGGTNNVLRLEDSGGDVMVTGIEF